MAQMKTLIGNSVICYQNVRYDCKNLPVTLSNQPLFWWLDSDRNQRYFLDGNELSTHVCACGKKITYLIFSFSK